MADELTHCPICWEAYVENGDHVPRILPCHYTLWGHCIGELLKSGSLECPQCRDKHVANNDTKSFPQNKYLVSHISRKTSEFENGDQDASVNCTVHNKVVEFYCDYPQCKKEICSMCLLKEHRKHKVLDLQDVKDQKFQTLLEKNQTLEIVLTEKKRKVSAAKEEMKKNTEESYRKIKQKKDELIAKYDELLMQYDTQRTKLHVQVREELTALDEHLVVVNSIKLNTDKSNQKLRDLEGQLDLVATISTEVEKHSNVKALRCPVYKESCLTSDEMCGFLTLTEISVQTEDTGAAATLWKCGSTAAAENEDFHIRCAVTRTFKTEFYHKFPLHMVFGTNLSICGHENYSWKLVHWNEQFRQFGTKFIAQPAGMTRVLLDGKPCLALSYGNVIDFCGTDITPYKFSYTTEHTAEQVFNSSPSGLLYCYKHSSNQSLTLIKWVDCIKIPPESGQTTHVLQREISDVCSVMNGDLHYLIVTGDQGIHAHDVKGGSLAWWVEGKLPGTSCEMEARGVTTDGQGHLFVCDSKNACIHVLNLQGVYLKQLLREGEQSLGEPWEICHCWETSSLIVAHKKNNRYYISVIKIETFPKT